MLGLKRGTVKLEPHQNEWVKEAEKTIEELKYLLGDIAVDIQHIGSTAISSIHAKPIIDIAIGVRDLNDILPYIEILQKNNFIFRGEDIPNQLLFVMGDLTENVLTHHIHVVKWNGLQWNNYINFRDYLNSFPQKAEMYDNYKQSLAIHFSENRRCYTEKKRAVIASILEQANYWRSNNMSSLTGKDYEI